jgi:hypothetical protein
MNPGLSFEKSKGAKPIAMLTGGGEDIEGQILYLSETRGQKNIRIPPVCHFQILPPKEGREILTVIAASGGGKSFFAREYASLYMRMFPKRSVYVFSKLAEDVTLDKLEGLKRIKIQSLIDEPITDISIFKDSLTIWDDCDSFTGEEKKAVNALRDDMLAMGRHHCISMIVMSHLATNGKDSRLLLSESHRFILFMASVGYQQTRYLCERYLGLTSKEIQALRKIPSRWVAVGKNFPSYVISDGEARILIQD